MLVGGERGRLIVLGLDGLPLDLARRLAPSLPGLARLMDGAAAVRAELPELSPVNWTSMATGEGPKTHGVWGFSVLDPKTYRLRVVDSGDVARPTVFDALGEAGLASKVINLPNTYPARPLRGMLVAGFVAPELSRAVYPPFLAQALAGAGYRLEADTTRGAADPEHLLRELSATLDSRRAALDMLWPDLNFDLFVFVLTETDRLFHFLYPAVARPEHALHADCMGLLRKWDALIGEVLDRYDTLPGPKRLIALADHGFTETITEVDVNRWLAEHGYLELTGTPADEWDASVISPTSTAFALDPGRIYIHTADRFARGSVPPARAESLAREISEGLSGLTFEGGLVMQQVARMDRAEADGQAPDILCTARPGFDLKAKFGRDSVFGRFGRLGCHTAEGAFWYDSQGERPGRMRDVGQLILNYFNVPRPSTP